VDPTSFVVTGRTYVMPAAPVVVICIDGSEPDYHVAALEAGRMPWLRGVLDSEGSSWPAGCALPALTNPNNLSIATGHPPAVHGISGNYIFDAASGEQVLMNDKRFLRAPTVFAGAAAAGLGAAQAARRRPGRGRAEPGRRRRVRAPGPAGDLLLRGAGRRGHRRGQRHRRRPRPGRNAAAVGLLRRPERCRTTQLGYVEAALAQPALHISPVLMGAPDRNVAHGAAPNVGRGVRLTGLSAAAGTRTRSWRTWTAP
jgi:hypothetical protein